VILLEIPRDLLIPILQNKIKTIFKLHTGKYEICGERNLTVGRKSFAVADILSTESITLNTLSQKDVELGGFKTKDDFKTWWFVQGYREYNPIYIIRFDLLKLKPLGKWYLKKNKMRVPIIKDNVGDYDE
jgi:hypothetical protein